MPLELTRRASADLDDIYNYGLDRWGEQQAEAYLTEFWRLVESIERFPLLARERVEFTPPVRVRRFDAHQVIYVFDGQTVILVRVPHGRSDWTNDLA